MTSLPEHIPETRDAFSVSAAKTIVNRTVQPRASDLMSRMGMTILVRQVASLVDGFIEAETFKGGLIVYDESIENPDDWEILVVTKLNISSEECFDLSLRMGEALVKLISHDPSNANWLRVSYRLELAH